MAVFIKVLYDNLIIFNQLSSGKDLLQSNKRELQASNLELAFERRV